MCRSFCADCQEDNCEHAVWGNFASIETLAYTTGVMLVELFAASSISTETGEATEEEEEEKEKQKQKEKQNEKQREEDEEDEVRRGRRGKQ